MGVNESSKGLSVPWSSASEGRHPREVGGESLFRGVAARGNYLGQDRMDIQFAAKEISRLTPSQRGRTGEQRRDLRDT